MRFEAESFPRFNLNSMAGVYAGTRAERFYRLRLWALSEQPPTLRWYQLNLRSEATGDPASLASPRLLRYQPQSGGGEDEAGAASIQLPVKQDTVHLEQLPARLHESGFGLHACMTCQFWRQVAPPALENASPEDVMWGRCMWTPESDETPNTPATAEELATQSGLALGCGHWEAIQPERHTHQSHATTPAPPPPSAPASDAKPGIWARLQAKLRPEPSTASRSTLRERSGVGAGTEPCFACHGRLANLGALVVESPLEDKSTQADNRASDAPSGDPMTFSVWRCRACKSTYLNRWVDRWVRTENLETDESYYRIAPVEAAQVLAMIQATPGADHPENRRARAPLRQQLETLSQTSMQISRQIKQGR